MEALVKKISELALKCFTTQSETDFKENLKKLTTLVNSISSKDVKFDPDAITEKFHVFPKTPIIYIPVCKNGTFSIRIFAIRAGSQIPLHDHPEMFGLCKVLHGSIRLKSFTDMKDQCIPHDISDDSSGESRLKPVSVHEDSVVNMNDNCVVLTPHDGNYHEIEALGGMAAFLDLLAPPYGSEDQRVCHYYEFVDNESDMSSVRWLKQIATPSGIHCKRMNYTGPPVE